MNTISDLKHQLNMLRVFAAAAAVCLIAAVIFILIMPAMAVVLVIVAAVIYFLLYRSAHKRYDNAVNTASLERTLCRKLNAGPPDPEKCTYLTENNVLGSHLIPIGDSDTKPMLCWEVHGIYRELDVALCDATSVQKYVSLSGKDTVHTNSGVFCDIGLKKDTNRHFILMETDFLPLPVMRAHFKTLPEYTPSAPDNGELAEKFSLYISDRDENGTLPNLFEQTLKSLSDYTPGYVAVSADGDHLYIFISGRFVSRPVSMTRSLTEEDISSDPLPELKYMLDLAESL